MCWTGYPNHTDIWNIGVLVNPSSGTAAFKKLRISFAGLPEFFGVGIFDAQHRFSI